MVLHSKHVKNLAYFAAVGTLSFALPHATASIVAPTARIAAYSFYPQTGSYISQFSSLMVAEKTSVLAYGACFHPATTPLYAGAATQIISGFNYSMKSLFNRASKGVSYLLNTSHTPTQIEDGSRFKCEEIEPGLINIIKEPMLFSQTPNLKTSGLKVDKSALDF